MLHKVDGIVMNEHKDTILFPIIYRTPFVCKGQMKLAGISVKRVLCHVILKIQKAIDSTSAQMDRYILLHLFITLVLLNAILSHYIYYYTCLLHTMLCHYIFSILYTKFIYI